MEKIIKDFEKLEVNFNYSDRQISPIRYFRGFTVTITYNNVSISATDFNEEISAFLKSKPWNKNLKSYVLIEKRKGLVVLEYKNKK